MASPSNNSKLGYFWNKQNKNKIFSFNSQLKTSKKLKRDFKNLGLLDMIDQEGATYDPRR